MQSVVTESFTEVGNRNIQISFGDKIAQKPKALIVFNLGIPRGKENDKSHEPFKGLANYLNDDYICATYSPAGMGRSTGDTTELSLHGRTEELLAVISFCQTRFPNLPLFLYGASMGAHVTLAATEQINPDGVVLASPAAYADRAEYSHFDGIDFSQTARLIEGDRPLEFSVMKKFLKYKNPVMLVWLEKDRLSKGGPIWDIIFEAYNQTLKSRLNHKDKILEIEGLEHGYRLNGVDPGPDNPQGIEGQKKAAIEIDLFIRGLLK